MALRLIKATGCKNKNLQEGKPHIKAVKELFKMITRCIKWTYQLNIFGVAIDGSMPR